MKILSIETSCDETALAIVEINESAAKIGDFSNLKVLDTALYSQIETHKEYGGVFPALAKREHVKNILPLLSAVLESVNLGGTETKISPEKNLEIQKILERESDLTESLLKFLSETARPEIDLITVTNGPGLEPALWVGINFARALSIAWQIPVVPANHMEGHIVSALFNQSAEEVKFPAIALLISGGHTEIVHIADWGNYEIIGRTRDDAVGEAYDKVARLLNLTYPGGPEISRLADEHRQEKGAVPDFQLPRPMLNSPDFDFSFSGLKTAVLYLIRDFRKKLNLEDLADLPIELKKEIAFEFENAVTEVLFKKTTAALKKHKAKTLIIGGGVIANKHLRETFQNLENPTEQDGDQSAPIKVLIPEHSLATDNAVMIALAGYFNSLRTNPQINAEIVARGNLEL